MIIILFWHILTSSNIFSCVPYYGFMLAIAFRSHLPVLLLSHNNASPTSLENSLYVHFWIDLCLPLDRSSELSIIICWLDLIYWLFKSSSGIIGAMIPILALPVLRLKVILALCRNGDMEVDVDVDIEATLLIIPAKGPRYLLELLFCCPFTSC